MSNSHRENFVIPINSAAALQMGALQWEIFFERMRSESAIFG